MNIDTDQIIADSREIHRYQEALLWLNQYAEDVLIPEKISGFEVKFNISTAGRCRGASEAEEMLGAMAKFTIKEITQSAIANCENTIGILSDRIERALGRD